MEDKSLRNNQSWNDNKYITNQNFIIILLKIENIFLIKRVHKNRVLKILP